MATGFFGDTIWVIITVETTGTMALTQQVSIVFKFKVKTKVSISTMFTVSQMDGVHFRQPADTVGSRMLPPPTAARPHSPTDGGGDFVSARNLLERSLNNSASQATNEDEEMN